MNVTYDYACKNNVVFKQGDYGTNFYIIIQGKLEVQKNTESYHNLNAEEYFKLLKSISDKGYSYLAIKSARANNSLFNINTSDEDFNKLYLIAFLVKFRYYIKQNYAGKSYISLFKDYGIDPNQFNLVLDKLDNNLDVKKPVLLNAFKIMFDKYNVSKLDLIHYSYIELFEMKKKIVIYNHETILTLNPGDCFGELALENKTYKRAATIFALEDTHLGKISNDIYSDYILNENQKYKSKEIAFLLNNYIFQPMSVKLFKKNFYNDFLRMTFPKYSLIMKQNQPSPYVYFIREGEVELSIESNLIQLNQMIDFLITKISDTKLTRNEEELIDYKTNKEFYDKKRVFKIFIYESKEALGLESLILNIPIIYQAKIITEKNKIYRLDTKKIDVILNDFKDCNIYGLNYAKSKVLLLIKRLLQLKTLTLKGMKDDKVLLNDRIISLEIKDNGTLNKSLLKDGISIKESSLLRTCSSTINMLNSRNIPKFETITFNQTYNNSEKNIQNKNMTDTKAMKIIDRDGKYTSRFSMKKISSEDIKITKHNKEYNRKVFNSTFIRNNSTNNLNKSIEKKPLSLPKISVVDPLGYDKTMKNIFPDLETLVRLHKEEMYKLIPDNEMPKIEEPKHKFSENFKIKNVYYTSFYQGYKIDPIKFKHNYILKKNKKI